MPRFHTLMFVIALVLQTVLPTVVQAQQAPELVLADKSDVRIIVDISGSMKSNDPDNLRQPAVRLLAEMLPAGSMAGLWTFGQYVNMLVPHREVTDQWRAVARDKSAQINSVALRTNLGKAIEVAGDGYYTGGVLENTHFILLTDGKVDVSDDAGKNQEEERRILGTLVPELAKQGATFHPIALSAEADAEFLRQLALQSGGRFQVAETAEALSRAFLEALNAAVPQEQIPIEGDGFTVDEGVSEFTALVFWGEQETRDTRELTLEKPDGSSVALTSLPENVRWNREAGYDLMTITEPVAGRWRIEGELGEGSRVTVVSDLRMAVSPVPARFSEETPIDLNIAFYEEGEKITDPDFLQVLDIKVSVISEDGRSGTKDLSAEPPVDGMFTDTIGRLPEDGVYQIEVVADGQTFGRKFSTTTVFTAVSPVLDQPAGEVEEAEVAVTDEAEAGTQPEPMPEESTPEPDSVTVPASVNGITSPIDVSEVETPEIAEAPETEAEPIETGDAADNNQSASPMPPMWVFGAGAGGIGLMALVWLALRKKQAKASEDTDSAEANESVPMESEEPEAPEEELEEEPEAAVARELEDEEASDDIPEKTEELDTANDSAALETDVDEVPEEEIPIAESVVPEEVGGEEESDDPVEAPILQDAESDEEEFGLDDFDLSEFDDLPGHSDIDSDQSDNQPKPDTDDSDQKK
ncbi:VWA domain-containing protein [Marinobacter apostichopi]|uniref:VWA domain-containing protein n=1 Tax=Marinobacter apostichopi TaxID=3035454 RepID=UPI002572E783|nr:VWA domain-containing protein [Marinobacter sp. LA51]